MALPDVPHVVALSLPLRALADDHEPQLAWVVSALLDPAVREVGDEVRGLEGEPSVTSWPAGGAVVVTWAAPVPAAVRALDGTRADGVRVLVLEVPYSARDLQRAIGRATRAVRALPPAVVRRAVRRAADVPVNLLVYPAG